MRPSGSVLTVVNPQLFGLPRGTSSRLIDRGLLQHEASIAGKSERYGRGETSHTIHVWWARRPHAAMRALVFATLCKDTNNSSMDLLNRLSIDSMPDNMVLHQARDILRSAYGKAPRVLDMFGGGGTIPFECALLGAEAHSIDSNQLSVFLQRSNLNNSSKLSIEELILNVRKSATRILQNLEKLTDPVFPLRNSKLLSNSIASISTYLWTYSKKCAKCQYEFFLLKRPWLSKKAGKNIAFILQNYSNRQVLDIGKVGIDYEWTHNWSGRNGTIQCPKCSHLESNVDALKCEDKLVAVILSDKGQGKQFELASTSAIPDTIKLEMIEKKLLNDIGIKLPISELPVWSGIVNPAVYGIKTHSDFVNVRQRIVLLSMVKCLREEYKNLRSQIDEDSSKYIIAQLSSFIDQLVDWNCRLSMWIPQNEQVGRAFCGPGIPMLWDYAEIDPVANGPANLWSKLERIIRGMTTISNLPRRVKVQHAIAQNLPYQSDSFDAIITDPPYYDNIYYSVLADFYYAWKRLAICELDPGLFFNPQTDSENELVASTFRNGTPDSAHEQYCHQLSLALKEAARVLKTNGVFTFIYSHSSLNGWLALLRAYRDSKLRITSVQPLSIERKQRPRAMSSEAINTCVAFVARRHSTPRKSCNLLELLKQLNKISRGSFAQGLTAAGWTQSDIALSVFAHGVALVSNSSKVRGVLDDREALLQLAGEVQKEFPDFKLKIRSSL